MCYANKKTGLGDAMTVCSTVRHRDIGLSICAMKGEVQKTMDDDKTQIELFKRLEELAKLSQYNLEEHFNDENISIICQIATILLGDNFKPVIDSAQEFIVYVYGLRDLNARLSRRLSEAILSSNDKYDNGETDAAIKIIDEFIENSPSPYLIEIAQRSKKKYLLKRVEISDDVDREWITKTAKTLIDAYENYEKGDKETALKMLEEIIKKCPIQNCKEDAIKLKDDIIKGDVKKYRKWSDRER